MTFPDPSSKSAALFERAKRVLPGGSTRTASLLSPYPLYAARAQGCRITDVDGVERIDFVNNMSSLIHGHANPAVLEAITSQSRRLLAAACPTEQEIELAELLVERVPGVDQIRFSNSGSEGVLMALRAARAFTGRPRIAKVEGAYHGNPDSVEVSIAPSPGSWGPAHAPASVAATAGISQNTLDETLVLPFNDLQSSEALLHEHGDALAAVVLDPVVSRMGLAKATPEYLAMIRRVTREHGILLVFDEVFSFRLGYHGLQGEVRVTPDLTALGKIIGGGLPVGATGGRADIMEVFNHTSAKYSVEHGGTYNGNPMTMAAGLACMRQMTPDAYRHLARLGDKMRDGLRKILTEADVPSQITGQGSLVGLYFVEKPFATYRDLPADNRARKMFGALHRHLLNHGIYSTSYGLFVLSTAMTDADIDKVLAEVKAGLPAARKAVA